MSAHLQLPQTDQRSELYAALFPQIGALLGQENDPIAAMANMSAALMQTFSWHWIGFYRVLGKELVVGPFQGPVACSPIAHGAGVCGKAWAEDRIFIVDDVNAFPGHIACSETSKSEIVIPLHHPSGGVAAVLDVDSAHIGDFDQEDALELGRLCALIEPFLK